MLIYDLIIRSHMSHNLGFINGSFLASCSLFLSFLWNNWCIKFCWWLHLNCGSLVLEATTLPTEPQPMPSHYLGLIVPGRHRRSLSKLWSSRRGRFFADPIHQRPFPHRTVAHKLGKANNYFPPETPQCGIHSKAYHFRGLWDICWRLVCSKWGNESLG